MDQLVVCLVVLREDCNFENDPLGFFCIYWRVFISRNARRKTFQGTYILTSKIGNGTFKSKDFSDNFFSGRE